MRAPVATIALALLLVGAGCLSPSLGGPERTDSSPTAVRSTPTDASTPGTGGATTDALATRSGTDGGATAAASRPNPWGNDPIVVAVENEADPDRSLAPLVDRATRFWGDNDERYLGYSTAFEVRPNATDPDVIVRLASNVPDCGVTDAVGCAPLVNDSRRIDRPETIWIRGGLSNDSTVLVLEHEFGHALGLTHADAPSDVMAAKAVLHTQPRPDAAERDFPWNHPGFAVYVDDRNVSDRRATREQVRRAFEYYESGAPGMPANLSFRFVDEPETADVTVRFSDTAACGSGAGSCIATRGTDPDGDGAIERYTHARITLVNLDTDAVGWHVGYWFAAALGAADDDEKPPPFRDASYRDRRSEWWQ